MSSSSAATAISQATDRVMKFSPAHVEVSDSIPLIAAPAPIRFQKRTVGQDTATALAGDPSLPVGISLRRVAGNTIATFVLVLGAGLVIAGTAPRLFGFGSVVVTTGSMEPAIRPADVVVTSPSDGEGLAAGAVINFEHEGAMRLHRIADVTPSGYQTIGDANHNPDSDLVQPEQIAGTGTVVVPFVGLPSTWWSRGEWLPLMLTVTVILAACYMGRSRWVEAKTNPLRS